MDPQQPQYPPSEFREVASGTDRQSPQHQQPSPAPYSSQYSSRYSSQQGRYPREQEYRQPEYPQQAGYASPAQPQYPQQSGYSQHPQQPAQYAPQGYPSQPYPQAAQPPPYSPQGYSPQPHSPQPYSPQPHSPQGYSAQPYSSQQSEPPPYLAASTSAEARQAVADRGKRDIIFGAIWLAAGLGITVCSFAYFGGVAGLIAWGPAAYGIYKIIKGVVTLNRR